ncbi:Fructosamine/Ketosamine-3-kinase [Xylaria bambusicola]|uniref:Fructosamine/Ketosamine-3-kinase n=1 Tax=Xylaria bambusicola TaxID=326684 RepID=UPI00200841A3|nr:Fructosamine/Ketosamine-3-kinase [Xylaria bambusicola]KAI0518491.1 Fructosamine/Ketosamine-3-kinase [Xylaria bambusicola]
MMKGAFEAENALYDVIPEYVPRPVSYGTYMTHPDLHFYICDFVDLVDEVPSPAVWAEAAATLHKRSRWPTGQFGFHCPGHVANVLIDNIWDSSWESVWTHQMRSLLRQDEAIHGVDEKYSELQATFFDVVIPTYLRPLESNGRSITPCLVHSNLWPGNIKPRADSNTVCMFDSCACWGHHEAELAVCRNPRYRLGKTYIEEYLKHMPISEPVEDFDTRNAIYAMKYHIVLSIAHHQDPEYRQIAIREMKQLVEQVTRSVS